MQINTINPLRSDYHIMTKGVFWQLKQEHRAEHWGLYLTKAEAIGDGVDQARQGHVSLIIHGRDGKIQSVWNYRDAMNPFR